MTRVREEALRLGTAPAHWSGCGRPMGITSAGLVLAGTFSVLASLSLTFLTRCADPVR